MKKSLSLMLSLCAFLSACGHSEYGQQSIDLLNNSGDPMIGLNRMTDAFVPNPTTEASLTLRETWSHTYTHNANFRHDPLQPTTLGQVLFVKKTPMCTFLVNEMVERAPIQKVSLSADGEGFYSYTYIVNRAQLDRYLTVCPPMYDQDAAVLLSIVQGFDEQESTSRAVATGAKILLFPAALALSFLSPVALKPYYSKRNKTTLSFEPDGKIRAIDGDDHNDLRHKEVIEKTRWVRDCYTHYDSKGERYEDCHDRDETYYETIYY